MKRQKNALRLCISIIVEVCIIAACVDDSFSEHATIDEKPTAVEYIRQRIALKPHFSLPDKRIKNGKKVQGSGNIGYDVNDFTPQWDDYQVFGDREHRVWLIPLKTKEMVLGQVYTSIKGEKKNYATPATFKLMVLKNGNRVTYRILTYIPERVYLRGKKNKKVKDLGYDLRGTPYCGLVFLSSLNGEIIFGLKYEKGVIRYRISSSRHGHSEETSQNAEHSPSHISYSFKSKKGTRSNTYYDEELGYEFCADCGRLVEECTCSEMYCSFCHLPVDYCQCQEVWPDPHPEVCWKCGHPINYCQCCEECGNFPCICAPWYGGGEDGDGNNGGDDNDWWNNNDFKDPDPNTGGGSGNPSSFDNTPLTSENFLDKIISERMISNLKKEMINISNIKILLNMNNTIQSKC